MLTEKEADAIKIGGGTVLGAVVVGYCVYVAGNSGPNPFHQVLICAFGGLLGWVVGILLTPLDDGEKKQFSEYAKGVSTLLSGFALAKLESLASLLPPNLLTGDLGLTRVLLFSSCFLVGTLFTFIGRRYVRGSEAEHQAKRQKLVGELEESLRKLRAAA